MLGPAAPGAIALRRCEGEVGGRSDAGSSPTRAASPGAAPPRLGSFRLTRVSRQRDAREAPPPGTLPYVRQDPITPESLDSRMRWRGCRVRRATWCSRPARLGVASATERN